MSGLQLADGLELPVGVLGQKIACIGGTGSGKTSTAAVIVEEAQAQGVPFVIFDPTGAWSGLGSNAANDGPGLPVVILGGEQADIPLEREAGSFMGQLVVDRSAPDLVVDLSDLPKTAKQRVVYDAMEVISARNREPLLIVIDEAHLFVPQSAGSSERGGYGARVHGAIVDAVTTGRRRGLGFLIATPRPARLSKDVFELVDVLIAHRMRGTNDRKVIAAWTDDEAPEDSAAILSLLPGFKAGEALVSAPGAGVHGVWRMRMKRTFDSSASPIESGRAAGQPLQRASVDLAAVQQAMAATIERQADEDPERLRARIRELEAALDDPTRLDDPVRQTRAAADEELQQRVDELAAHLDSEREARLAAQRRGDELQRRTTQLAVALNQIGDTLEGVPEWVQPEVRGGVATNSEPSGPGPEPEPQPPAAAVRGSSATNPPPAAGEAPPLRAGAVRMLRALVAANAMLGTGLDRDDLVLQADVSKGGTMSNYLGALRAHGLIDQDPGGLITPTASAVAEPAYAGGNLLTAEQILDRETSRLRRGAATMLRELARVRPDGLTRKQLSIAAGVAPGGTMSNYLGSIRKRGLLDEQRSRVRLHPRLFLATEGRPPQ